MRKLREKVRINLYFKSLSSEEKERGWFLGATQVQGKKNYLNVIKDLNIRKEQIGSEKLKILVNKGAIDRTRS